MIYEWRPGRSKPVSAQVVGETVERLEKENNGVCPPSLLVDEARPDESPLHNAFTWDDEVAGEAWRRQEARQLTNSIRIVTETDESDDRPPAFVHIKVTTSDGEESEGYASTVRVVKDSELRRQMLSEALSSLNALRRRYKLLKELAPVWDAVDRLAS